MSDSYRPGRSDRDRDRNRNRDRDRHPSLADRMTFTSGGGDSYRPGDSQRRSETLGKHAEFTFQSNHPAPEFLPSAPGTGSGPRRQNGRRGRGGPRNGRRDDYPDTNHPRNRNHANGFRRGGFRKAAPHERALLQKRDGGSPEHTMGVSDGPNRFLNIEDLSDEEEEDMDVETEGSTDNDTEDDDRHGQQKAARTRVLSRADGDSVPKWSNPDPYTVLPPPEETTGKRTDFVKLIRKAKNQAAEKSSSHNAVAANDDFISFNDDDKDDKSELHMYEDDELIFLGRQAKGQHTIEDSDSIPLRGRQSVQGSMNETSELDLIVQESQDRSQPATTARFDDEPQRPARNKKRKLDFDVGILEAWLPRPNSDPTPWLRAPENYAHLANDPNKWLHNEILDFNDFVSPNSHEHNMRKTLVARVDDALGRRILPGVNGRIYSFGSFPAGLYLPTADMDLVYTSEQHHSGGNPVIDLSVKGANKKMLYRVARLLHDKHISVDMPTVIAMAKVPIVKFKDRLTNYQVDISFENLSGLQAQATFATWKREYPDLEYMVVLLKQFLAMRGLNEVHTGGIGGFSIICLVVSYLQHHEKAPHLGACLMGFFDYYGNKFDLSRKRIQMCPPAIKEKTDWGIDNRPEKFDGLSIQDPNRPDNNISGGSYRAKDAFKAFSAAHRALQNRISIAEFNKSFGSSVLQCIIGGCYESYHTQRRLLYLAN